RLHLVLVELLLLMRDVLRLASRTHAVPLHGTREDHGRLALVAHGAREGGVHLHGVVAAAVEAAEVFVAPTFDELLELGRVEELLLQLGPTEGGVALGLTVDQLLEAAHQRTLVVLGEKLVPGTAPSDLDDVPAGAAEDPLEFLDDLPVPVHRAVEALEVAVDDPDEVVEPRPRRDADGAERLGFVGLAVTQERPHLPVSLGVEAAVLQVAPEARLVDRHDRTE